MIRRFCRVSLIVDGQPALGYVHRFEPDRGILGIVGEGAWAVDSSGTLSPLGNAPVPETIRYVAYKETLAEMSDMTGDLHRAAGARDADIVHGKLLPVRLETIITGGAEVYIEPRMISEWDVAAALAIVKAQNGNFCALDGARPFAFNNPSMRVPPFLLTREGVRAEQIAERLSV